MESAVGLIYIVIWPGVNVGIGIYDTVGLGMCVGIAVEVGMFVSVGKVLVGVTGGGFKIEVWLFCGSTDTV